MSSNDANPSALCLDDASYVLGTLSPAERQAFEQHLTSCPACQASVARLAGLPGLLALTSAADIEGDLPPVPETLLPRLLATAAAERRRRRWIWVGSMAAAAAAVVALVLVLAIRPATTPAVALSQPVPMTQLVAGPMNASLQLTDKQWGTSIVVNCHYAGGHDAGDDYRLVVFDSAGHPQTVSSWKSVSGAGSTIPAATSLRLAQITRLEVQLPSGLPVLTAVPRHS